MAAIKESFNGLALMEKPKKTGFIVEGKVAETVLPLVFKRFLLFLIS